MRDDSSNYDAVFALSFFLISSKTGALSNFSDTLIGIILYDLKNKKILAFNIETLTSFIEGHFIDENKGLYDVIKYLFDKTINEKLEANSYLPFPIDSPCYATLPWICYSVYQSIGIDNPMIHAPRKIISIPEFFVFGYASSPEEESGFVFNNFSIDKQGRALCILNLNELERKSNIPLDLTSHG